MPIDQTQAYSLAVRQVSGLVRAAGPNDLVVLAGLGDGWHALALVNALGAQRLVVYAPGHDGGGPQGVTIAASPGQLIELLAEKVVYGTAARIAVYPTPGCEHLAPQARELVGQALGRASVDGETRATKNLLWAKYLAENTPKVLSTADVASWVNAFRGTPALVIGAGPSLTNDLPLMAGLRGRALMLGAASVLGPMAKAGLVPHCVAAIEAKDESRQFIAHNFKQILLSSASCAHPNHFKLWPGVSGHFHLQTWAAEAFGGMVMPTGGHATSAAFTMAMLWGCDPIILVGQDLAYSGGKIHAEGRPGADDDGVHQHIEVPAIGGGNVRTSHVFSSYISWYAESASYITRSHPNRRIINCTSQGALLPGFEHMPLSRISDELVNASVAPDCLVQRALAAELPDRARVVDGLGKVRRQLIHAIDNPGPVEPGSAPAYALEGLGQSVSMDVYRGRLNQLLEYISRAREAANG